MKKLINLLLILSILLAFSLTSCTQEPDGTPYDDIQINGDGENTPSSDEENNSDEENSSDEENNASSDEESNSNEENNASENNSTEVVCNCEDNSEEYYNALEDTTYGVFKKFANDNFYEAFTKSLNSAHTTAETQDTLKKLHDRFGHYAQLQIYNDTCYVAFMHGGQGGDAYYQDDYGVTMAVFSLDRALSSDFNYNKDVKLYKIANIGDKFAGLTLRSSCNSPSMQTYGNKIFTTLTFDIKEQGQWGVFVAVFDMNTNTFVEEYQMKLRYKGEKYNLDNTIINQIYTTEGYKTTPPNMILVSTDWSLYNGEYYSTIIVDTHANNGIIVKTRDFRTLDFVSVVKGNDEGQCEVATYVFKGKVYVACRQPWTTPYLLFMRYDLETGEWLDPYKIEDGNSRAWIFEYKGELYLFNTIEEPGTGWRRYANISKIRTDTVAHTGKNAPVDVVATIFECGDHHSYCVYKGHIYFTATINSRIHFGELKLKDYSTEKVNDRLIELFGDLE